MQQALHHYGARACARGLAPQWCTLVSRVLRVHAPPPQCTVIHADVLTPVLHTWVHHSCAHPHTHPPLHSFVFSPPCTLMPCAPALAHSYTFMPLSLHTSHLVHSPPSMLTLAHSHAHPLHTHSCTLTPHGLPLHTHPTHTVHTPLAHPLPVHPYLHTPCTLTSHALILACSLHTHILCTLPSCTPTHSLAHTTYTPHAHCPCTLTTHAPLSLHMAPPGVLMPPPCMHTPLHTHTHAPPNKAPSATSGILGSECGILGSGCGIWGLKLRF